MQNLSRRRSVRQLSFVIPSEAEESARSDSGEAARQGEDRFEPRMRSLSAAGVGKLCLNPSGIACSLRSTQTLRNPHRRALTAQSARTNKIEQLLLGIR